MLGAFILLWGFMFITLLAGLVQFIHMTIGLYSVVATFWLTYYTFLGVRLFKNSTLKEV
jgi:small basic protein